MHTLSFLALVAGVSAGFPRFCTLEDRQLSCQNTVAISNRCCVNSPGGHFLLTQSWNFDPIRGPSDSWTIHGLWPNFCDQGYPSYCDESRNYTHLRNTLSTFGKSSLLSYMNTYWKTIKNEDDEEFWRHEWFKHGTCISTLESSCYSNYTPREEAVAYFERTVDLFQKLPSYQWLAEAGITPSKERKYTSAQIHEALSKHHGYAVDIQCNDKNELEEIWYHYNVEGSVQSGYFNPTDPVKRNSHCSPAGVVYRLKGDPVDKGEVTPTEPSSPPVTSEFGTTANPTTPFTGNGYLNVVTNDVQKGCVISTGRWFVSGRCATFRASPVDSGFILTSSKGNCSVSENTFVCNGNVTTPSIFASESTQLSFGGSARFYANTEAVGHAQEPLYTIEHALPLQIIWQSA